MKLRLKIGLAAVLLAAFLATAPSATARQRDDQGPAFARLKEHVTRILKIIRVLPPVHTLEDHIGGPKP